MVERLTALRAYAVGHLLGMLAGARSGQILYYSNGGTEEAGHVSVGGVAEEAIHELRELGIASQQVDILATFLRRHKKGGPFFVNLQGDLLTEFHVAVGKVQSVFAEELRRRDFEEPLLPKGGMNYEALRTRGTEVLFPDGFPPGVPDLTKEDLGHAIASLIAGLPTPAAMVALRAAEGMLRATYTRFTGQPPAAESNWKIVEQELVAHVKKSDGRLAEALEHHLATVRRVRNQAEHPQDSFNQVEAEDAVNQAVFLVKALAKAK